MEYKVKAYNIWEVGQKFDKNGNPHQEDALFPEYGRCTPEDRVFVLCDGMGGHDNGEVASSVVCTALPRSVMRQLRMGSGSFRESIFDSALQDAYNALDVNDTGSPKKMGTTMAFLCLYEKGYFMAHIGDTRIYHIRPGDDEGSTQIIFSTTDHSLVNKLVASGKMSLEEATASTHRHVITRAMQPHMDVRPAADVEISSDIRSGDYFLMCTYGMLENLSDRRIKRIFSRLGGNDANKVRELLAASANNRDNHSAIIVHIEEVMNSRTARQAASRTEKAPGVASTDVGNNRVTRGKPQKQNSAHAIMERVRHTGGMQRIVVRFLIALMALLSVIMVIYYAFIHTDEAMLEAGRTYDSPAAHEEYDPYKPDEERYGYETRETEVIDDRVIETDEPEVTDQTTTEETSTEDENQTVADTPEKTAEPAAESTQAPTPATEPDMPILQE